MLHLTVGVRSCTRTGTKSAFGRMAMVEAACGLGRASGRGDAGGGGMTGRFGAAGNGAGNRDGVVKRATAR